MNSFYQIKKKIASSKMNFFKKTWQGYPGPAFLGFSLGFLRSDSGHETGFLVQSS
jgi:hypothetical protein